MATWLVGIGIAGFFLSLLLSSALRPGRPGRSLERRARLQWRIGSLAIALAGAALAALFAWPAWFLGCFVGPYFGFEESVGGALFACIFGLGGAAVTGGFSNALREAIEKEHRTR